MVGKNRKAEALAEVLTKFETEKCWHFLAL